MLEVIGTVAALTYAFAIGAIAPQSCKRRWEERNKCSPGLNKQSATNGENSLRYLVCISCMSVIHCSWRVVSHTWLDVRSGPLRSVSPVTELFTS